MVLTPFAPEIIGNWNHAEVTVSPDGKEIYWTSSTSILFSRMLAYGGWTAPHIVSFSGQGTALYYDDVPVVSPDNKKLFFLSKRPIGYTSQSLEHIWFVERTPTGWSEPEPLPQFINLLPEIHWQVSISANGTLYFSSADKVYASHFINGAYTNPVPLQALNAFGYLTCPFIAPDESYIIFCKIVSGIPEGYVSFKGAEDQWLPPQSLNQIHRTTSFVSRDGKYFFSFYHWISSEVVENLRPKLDGGGGGVLTYCYQPLDPGMGLHQAYGTNANGIGNRKLLYADIGLNHMDVSPDGKKVACVGYISANPETWSIHVFNMDGTGLSRLTTTPDIQDAEPTWSPDGTKIAFTRMNVNAGTEELWIMNADGTNQHSTGINGFAAKWSSDGTRFIYSKKSGDYEIYSCHADGTNEIRLTNTPTDETFPSWSHDGQQILYCSSNGDENTYEIYVMNSDGSNPRNLTSNASHDAGPRWSPNDSLIAFHSDRHQPGKWEIYLMKADGSEPQRVTFSQEYITAINPSWVPSGGSSGISATETKASKIDLYPNPADEMVSITIQNLRPEDANLTITNMKGQVLYAIRIPSVQDYTETIDVSGFDAGIYIVRVNKSAIKLLIY